MQLIWVSISDAFGRKPPLYVSLRLFFIGSVIFGVARNINTLIAGLVLQGLGGGGIDVLAQVILADMTTLEERSKYIGLMAIPTAIGNIMGPIVGALFPTFVFWRWIAWINLPIIGLGTSLVFFFLKLRPISLEATLAQNLNRLDWVRMALIIVGVTLFVVPLSWAGSLFPWASWQTLFPLLLGATLLVVVKNVDDTGLAIGQLHTIRMFGGLIGLTTSSAIFNNIFSESISNTAVQLTGALAPLKDASNEKLSSKDMILEISGLKSN
ncbi:uncharacterized protein TrAFT101_006341 [Trichoderma asperellum]|uniref:uncharacterized protein n=1 Tax=Trichoderma asperellum TaxID=101201 RepID=UPI003331FE95|nr:hypothetical protein TrAFT101_006341 [Trichoderma asperellum]